METLHRTARTTFSTARGPTHSLLQSRHLKRRKRCRKTAQSRRRQSCRGAACRICSSCTCSQGEGFQGRREGRSENRDWQRELPLRAYLARTVDGSKSLLARADSQARELGSRLNESLGELQRYGYKYLYMLLKTRSAVQLSELPSARRQRLRGSSVLAYGELPLDGMRRRV